MGLYTNEDFFEDFEDFFEEDECLPKPLKINLEFDSQGVLERILSDENSEFHEQLKKHNPFVQSLSVVFPLLSIGFTTENGYIEPAYRFDDGLFMPYTITGVMESLKEIYSN